MSPVSFEVAVGIALWSVLLGVFIAWHLFREKKALAELKTRPDLQDLYSALKIVIAPLDALHGTDWVFSRFLLREADVVFWEVSQCEPAQISHITEHLQRLTDITTAAQIEHVLQSVRTGTFIPPTPLTTSHP